MIKRKIMQMSNSSFITTLPKDWADSNGLIKGEYLEFENSGNDLIIKGKKDENIVKLDFSDVDYDLIWRHLVCVYRKGASKVIIKYGSKKNLQSILDLVRNLMGWGVVEQNKDKVIIKDLVPVENTDFDDVFKKVFLLVLNVSEETLEGLVKEDKNILDNICHLDRNINEFSNLCLRILNLKGLSYNRTNSLYKIISVLEEIADEYRKLAVFHTSGKLSPSLVDIFKRINNLLRFYYETFYDFDNKKFRRFYADAGVLLKDMKEFKKGNIMETRTFATLFTILHLIKSLSEENLVMKL